MSAVRTACRLPSVSSTDSKKRFLVIVNPNAGKGRAERMLAKVRAVFEAAGMSGLVEVVVTQRQLHALEYIRDHRSLDSLAAVLILSGDGLVHEVINGVYARPNWSQEMANIPIGVVPVGSGNALARYIPLVR